MTTPSTPIELQGKLNRTDARLAIVVARFNEFITEHLLHGCLDTWAQLGGNADRLTIARAPGSFELPVAARRLAETGNYQAVICLGCVIKGETKHYDAVVDQTAKGIKDAGVLTGIPVIFGVLTTDNLEQAIHRAGSKMGNAGRSSMMAAVEMADLMRQVREGQEA